MTGHRIRLWQPSGAAYLGGGSASGTAPTFDATSFNSAANSHVVTLTTSGTNEIVVVIYGVDSVNGAGAAATLATVSNSTNPLTWAKAPSGSITAHTSAPGTPYLNIELWWAFAAASGSIGTISAIATGTPDNESIMAFGVSGVGSSTVPWDTNSPFTGSDTGASTLPTVSSISTAQAGSLLITACLSAETSPGYTDQTASPGTIIGNLNSSSGTNFSKLAAQRQPFTTTQSGLSSAFGVSWNTWIAIAAALKGT